FIVQLTDIHLFEQPGSRLGEVDTDASLASVLEYLRHDLQEQGRQPDLILLTGDLTQDGSANAYVRLKDAMLDFRVPLAVLPGNHDLHATFDVVWKDYKKPWVDIAGWR